MLLSDAHTGPGRWPQPCLSRLFPLQQPVCGRLGSQRSPRLVLYETKPEKLLSAKSMTLPPTDLEHVFGLLRGPGGGFLAPDRALRARGS